MPENAQYALFALAALVITVVGLWAYNRRETRRKHAIELAGLMRQWGLIWFAEVFECYAAGDYSGLIAKVKEIITAIRSDEAMVAKLYDAAKKVTTYMADNDQTKADELRALLAAGKTATTAATTTATTTENAKATAQAAT